MQNSAYVSGNFRVTLQLVTNYAIRDVFSFFEMLTRPPSIIIETSPYGMQLNA